MKIVVVKSAVAESISNDDTLTLLFDNIRETSRGEIDPGVIDDMKDLYTQTSDKPKPTLKEFLLISIVAYAAEIYNLIHDKRLSPEVANTAQNIVIPIVQEILVRGIFKKQQRRLRSAEQQILKQTSTHGLSSVDAAKRKIGSGDDLTQITEVLGSSLDRPVGRHNKLLQRVESDVDRLHAAVNVRFDTPVRALTQRLLEYICGEDSEHGIIGMFVSNNAFMRKFPAMHDTASMTTQYLDSIVQVGLADHETIMFENAGMTAMLSATYDRMLSALKTLSSMKTTLVYKPAVSNVSPRTQIVFEQKPTTDEIALAIGSMFSIFIPGDSLSSIYSVLYRYDLVDIYMSAVMFGIDDDKTQAKIEKKKRYDVALAANATLARDQTALRAYENTLLRIVGTKLGEAKLAALERELNVSVPRPTRDNILATLAAPQRNLVLATYKAEQRAHSTKTSPCPHVKALREYTRAVSNRDCIDKFNDLAKFINVGRGKKTAGLLSMLQCTECGQDVCCGHVPVLVATIKSAEPYSATMQALKPFMTPMINGNHYCSVCAEILAPAEVAESVTGFDQRVYDSIDDELRSMMFGEVINVIKTLSFSVAVNVNRLVMSTITAIYEHMFDIEKQLIKSKTNTIEDINNKKRLFTCMYVYAYVVHMIMKTRGAVMKFADMKGPLNISSALKHAIVKIITTRGYIISSIANITNDFIKNKTIDAYRVVSSMKVNIEMTETTAGIYSALVLDPIYHYAAAMNKSAARLDSNAEKTITIVMGKPIDKITSVTGSIFTRALGIEIVGNAASFDKIALPSVENIGDANAIYTNSYRGYAIRSFELFADIHAAKYGKNTIVDTGDIDASAVVNKAFVGVMEKHKGFYEAERRYQQMRDYANAKNTVIWRYETSRNIVPKSAPLGLRYDEKGLTHVFDKFIFSDGTTKTKNEIIANLNAGVATDNTKYVDTQCSVCGIKRSEVSTLRPSVIKESMDTIEDMMSLHRFYQHRCPKSTIHEFGASTSTACVHCGLKFGEITIDYYTKYRADFEAQHAELIVEKQQALTVQSSVDVLSTTDMIKTITTQYATWVPDFNKPLKLSNILGCNNNLIMSLGSTEGVAIDDIISGRVVAPEPDDNMNQRLYILDSIIMHVIVSYMAMRNYAKIAKPPSDLREIVEKSDVKRFQYSQLATALPIIHADYGTISDVIKRTLKPRTAVEFYIETLADICLEIIALGVSNSTAELKLEKLCKQLVITTMTHVLTVDAWRSKPGNVNWKLFSKQRDVEAVVAAAMSDKPAVDSYDTNTDADVGVTETIESDSDSDVDDEKENTNTNAQLTNNFDIDTADADDRGDVDEDHNGIKLDDNGLSGIE